MKIVEFSSGAVIEKNDLSGIYHGEIILASMDEERFRAAYALGISIAARFAFGVLHIPYDPLDEFNIAGYNCAYVEISDPAAFSEMMLILMCGGGVGFSVERQFISKLPAISEYFSKANDTIVIGDSKIGWCEAYAKIIKKL